MSHAAALIEGRPVQLYPGDTTGWVTLECLEGQAHVLVAPNCPKSVVDMAVGISEHQQGEILPDRVKYLDSGEYGTVFCGKDLDNNNFAFKTKGGATGWLLDNFGLAPDSLAASTAVRQGLEKLPADQRMINGRVLGGVATLVAVFPVDKFRNQRQIQPVFGMEYLTGEHLPHGSTPDSDLRQLRWTLVKAIRYTEFPELNVHHDPHCGNFILDQNDSNKITKIDTGIRYSQKTPEEHRYMSLPNYLENPLTR